MIDIENKVFNTVADAISDSFPSAAVYSDYVDTPQAFPCVTLVENSNTTHLDSLDDALEEHHADLVYDLNVYANSSNAKSDAKAILDVADRTLQGMKFTRTYCQPTANVDRTIYRITARYTVVVGEGYESDGVVTHQMYRQ